VFAPKDPVLAGEWLNRAISLSTDPALRRAAQAALARLEGRQDAGAEANANRSARSAARGVGLIGASTR
jgi:hypothetical protein